MTGINALASTHQGTERERQKAALKEITSLLHKLDVRICALLLQTKEAPPLGLRQESTADDASTLQLMTVHHDAEGHDVLFAIEDESQGTQHLIGLVGLLLTALRKGRPAFIDDIDAPLHSLLVIELVRLFKARRTNENGAQLICTLHNTDLLAARLLELSDVGIVGQCGFSGTSVTRLAQVPKLRNVDNFRRLYLRGDFGGIPSARV